MNAYLVPGQFFALPLSDARFCAGVVLAVRGSGTVLELESMEYSKSVVLGLLDWVGSSHPQPEDLIGCSVLEWGTAHVKAINQHGSGEILGEVDPKDLGQAPVLKVTHRGGGTVHLLDRGFVLREATAEERRGLPLASYYGFRFMNVLGERLFVEGLPLVP